MTVNPILAALENAFAAPINAFLTAAQQPGVNVQSLAQNAGALDLQELLAIPGAESGVINAVAAAIQAKFNAVITPLPSAAPLAAVAPAPATGA